MGAGERSPGGGGGGGADAGGINAGLVEVSEAGGGAGAAARCGTGEDWLDGGVGGGECAGAWVPFGRGISILHDGMVSERRNILAEQELSGATCGRVSLGLADEDHEMEVDLGTGFQTNNMLHFFE